jgi:hypothetical protein
MGFSTFTSVTDAEHMFSMNEMEICNLALLGKQRFNPCLKAGPVLYAEAQQPTYGR